MDDPELVEFATKLFGLARTGQTDTLAAYVDAGVSADLTNDAGDTLLMLAAYHGHAGTVRALLDRGADPGRPNDRGHDEPDVGQYDTAGECFGASGAAALFRRAALADIGPEYFDEDLFAYYEDVDLAWRLSRRGWVHWYEPSVVCHHRRRGYEGKPACIAAAAFFNRYLVWLKNETLARFVTYAPIALPWEAARLVRQVGRHPLVFRGLARVARLAPKMLGKRR